MKRGIDLEPEVLQQYSDFCNVNASPSGFVIHPDAPYLGASPDAKVYDPTEDPPFGIAEVKCPNVDHITEASHIKFVNGQAKLRRNHKYFWQVKASWQSPVCLGVILPHLTKVTSHLREFGEMTP